MPILKMVRSTVVLAVELPEPFTVPTVIENVDDLIHVSPIDGFVIATKKLIDGSDRQNWRPL